MNEYTNFIQQIDYLPLWGDYETQLDAGGSGEKPSLSRSLSESYWSRGCEQRPGRPAAHSVLALIVAEEVMEDEEMIERGEGGERGGGREKREQMGE